MISARKLLPLGVVVALGGCVSEPLPPAAVMVVVSGQGKDLAAFQQDDAICRQHAAAQTGYGPAVRASADPSTLGVGTDPAANPQPRAAPIAGNSTNGPPAVMPPNEIIYMQCMAARGDSVEPEPDAYAAAYPGGPYPYWYGYSYAGYYGGFYNGLGFGWAGGGWDRGGWHGGVRSRGAYAHAGFARAGAGHGGSGHGGGHR